METTSTVQTLNGDMLRTLLYIRIAKMHTDQLLSNETVDSAVKTGAYRSSRELAELERKILNKTDNQFPWLRSELDKGKMWDISAIVDLIARLGHEENEEQYEMLLALFIQFINATLYAQSKRTKLNIERYKQLLKFITAEVERDVSNIRGQIVLRGNELMFRLQPKEPNQSIKPI